MNIEYIVYLVIRNMNWVIRNMNWVIRNINNAYTVYLVIMYLVNRYVNDII